MTQRKIERISGWIAFSCWLVFVALGCISISIAVNAPRTSAAPTAPPPVTKAHSTKHTAKAAQPAAVTRPMPREQSLAEQMTTLLAGFAFVLAWASTAVWNWRRKQRIRAEIRAEAWGRQSLESRRRDGRAVGV